MRTLLAICAEGVSTDQQTNVVSVFGIMEELTPEGLPALIPKLTFLVLFQREEGDADVHELNFELRNNERVVTTQRLTANFRGKNRTRLAVIFGGVPVEAAGTLNFRLLSQSSAIVAEWGIPVNAPATRVISPARGAEASVERVTPRL